MSAVLRAPAPGREAGFTMVEAMVAIVVLCFGLLALAAFQLRVLSSSSSASNRHHAILLAADIADRIRANPVVGVASASPYVADWAAAAATPSTNCAAATATCSKAQLAAYDVWAWKTAVASALPGGVANIAADAANGGQLFVHVAWSEPSVTNPISPPSGWGCPDEKAGCQEVAVAMPQL